MAPLISDYGHFNVIWYNRHRIYMFCHPFFNSKSNWVTKYFVIHFHLFKPTREIFRERFLKHYWMIVEYPCKAHIQQAAYIIGVYTHASFFNLSTCMNTFYTSGEVNMQKVNWVNMVPVNLFKPSSRLPLKSISKL
jgi:hypothetical protein